MDLQKIKIKSSSSNDIYTISLSIDFSTKNLKINCTCGKKFGLPERIKCKHIDQAWKLLKDECDMSELENRMSLIST